MSATTADLGNGSRGVWTRRQALEVMTRGQVQAALRRGEWIELWPCTYADAGFTQDAEAMAVAAVLAAGGSVGTPRPGDRLRAFASGRTAARVLGLPLVDDDDPATGAQEHLLHEVGGWSGGGPWSSTEPDGARRVLHRTRPALRAGDLVRRASGVWTTSVVRTVVDCASRLSAEALACLVDHVLHHEQATPDELLRAATDRTWCPGAPLLRATLADADARAETPAETLTRRLLLPVLPGLVPQVRLRDAHGRVVARFDLGDAGRRFAVETDGKRGHAGPAMVAKDQRRDRTSAELGWHTERCTWFDVRRRQDATVERVLAAARRHDHRTR